MKHIIAVLSKALGWAFVACTLYLGMRPGGPVRTEFTEWNEARQTRKLVLNSWVELSEGGTILGSNARQPSAVEFIDYGCGYCRVFHDSLTVFLSGSPEAAVTIRYLVSRRDSTFRLAAAAAICAARDGRFDILHEYLLTDTTWMRTLDWKNVGQEAGIGDLQDWENCMASQQTKTVLSNDSAWAERLNITGTPTLITRDGKLHPGLFPISTLEAWITVDGGDH